MMNTLNKYSFIIGSLLLLAVIVRVICFVGLIGSDDLNYNRIAYDITKGNFSPQMEHQRTRLGLFLPVAVAFKLFGINEVSSTLFPFLCFLLTFGLLVYMTTICFGRWIGLLAGLLYTFLPVEIFNASMLLPDLPAATFVALSGSIVYWVTIHSVNKHSPVSKPAPIVVCSALLIAGVMLGWAYLIRETALFLGIFIAGYMLYRMWTRKTIEWSWLWFWIGFFIIIGIEFGYYYRTTGTPFYRYLTVETGHNLSVLALRDRVHGLALLKRLTLDQLLVVFHVPFFSFYYFFIFAGIIYGIRKRVSHLLYFIGWFLTFFLLFNFASTSLVEYYPIRPIPRYFVVLSVPGVLIMSWYLGEIADFLSVNCKRDLTSFRLSLVIPFIFGCIVNIVWFSVAITLFLLFLSGLVLMSFSETVRIWFLQQIPAKYRRIILPLILLYVVLLPGIYAVAKRERPLKGITCERSIRPLLEFPLRHTIYTDNRTEVILEYFYEYQYDQQIHPFAESATGATIAAWKNAYVIANWERLYFLNRLYNTPIPGFLYQPPPHWKLYEHLSDEENTCIIYEIP